MFLTVSPLVSVLRSYRKYMGSAGSRRLVPSPAIGYFTLIKEILLNLTLTKSYHTVNIRLVK